jgi:hypothetical protein
LDIDGILLGMGDEPGVAGEREHLRAADGDRQAVADRLRAALDEGRLEFHEYDSRLGQAYAAKTYGELDPLVADLPTVAPAERSALAPASPGPVAASGARPFPVAGLADPTARWLLSIWDSYFTSVGICIGIWLLIAVFARDWQGFWPVWVAGPWGIFLTVVTIRGLATGEPARWDAKRHRRRAKQREKKRKLKEQGSSG